MTSEIIYPYIPENSYVVRAYADLPFAERALVIVEPDRQFWTLHLIRQNDRLRLIDDFESAGWRFRKGRNHSINCMGFSDSMRGGAQTLEEFYKNGIGMGRRLPRERETPGMTAAFTGDLPHYWSASRREGPELSESEALENLEQLFSDHLGIGFHELLDAGGKYDRRSESFYGDKPLAEIALRPLQAIPAGYRRPSFKPA